MIVKRLECLLSRAKRPCALPSNHHPPLCAPWHPFDSLGNSSGTNAQTPSSTNPKFKNAVWQHSEAQSRASRCAVAPPTAPPPPYPRGPTRVFEKHSDLWCLCSVTIKSHWTVTTLERGIWGYSKSVLPGPWSLIFDSRVNHLLFSPKPKLFALDCQEPPPCISRGCLAPSQVAQPVSDPWVRMTPAWWFLEQTHSLVCLSLGKGSREDRLDFPWWCGSRDGGGSGVGVGVTNKTGQKGGCWGFGLTTEVQRKQSEKVTLLLGDRRELRYTNQKRILWIIVMALSKDRGI